MEIRIGSTFDDKGFKKAGKQVTTLDKGVKQLAKSLAAVFGAQQLLKFAKNASKAFIEDEKAASQLTQSVKNLGLAFEMPRINKFISELSAVAGVADDVLRPSMQKLLQTTGSFAKSQELITQALDISRGSTVDYETVVQDLANAYVGNTKGLKKYSLGLTQAELKTMKFADVQAKLIDQFKGANAAYLDTYAGKMEVLKTAAGEASETIGKGLIDALMILSGDKTVEDLAVTMQELAENTASAIGEIAKLGRSVGSFFANVYNEVDDTSNAITDLLDRITGNSERINARNVGRSGRLFGGGSGGAGGNIADNIARRKAEEAAIKRAKQLAAMQAKQLADTKKKAALEKAARTLELERINLTAGLKGKISEADRLSLQLQLALLDKNDTLATKLAADLDAAVKRQNELAAALRNTPKAPNPYEDWKIPAEVLNYTAKSLGVTPEAVISAPQSIPMQATDAGEELRMAVLAALDAQSKADAAVKAAESVAATTAAAPINVKVEVAGEEVAAVITQQQTNQSLSGSFVNVNRLGRFANVPVAI